MLQVSFVVPCKNEEKYISCCVESLIQQEGEGIETEIIVVDNGSNDNTLPILKKYEGKIKIFVCPELSIAGLRNFGVSKSKHEWIAFIDADVEIDKKWGRMLLEFIDEKKKEGENISRIITGSTCLVPNHPTWIEAVWYEQLIARDSSETKYINSGNMVIHRELFQQIGGFDTSFKTGEEENLCAEARNRYGAIICKNNKMKAIHHGYPKTIAAFFRRMRWHGKGMSKYLLTPWKSKPLLLALYYISVTILFTLISIVNPKQIPIYLLLFILFQIFPVIILSCGRSGGNFKNTILLSVLYLFFGWARVLSIFDTFMYREVYHKK